MSKKSQIKKAIEDCELEIQAYEKKCERSQKAIMRAMLAGTKPLPEDEQYFTTFSSLIDQSRDRLRGLYAELKGLNKK